MDEILEQIPVELNKVGCYMWYCIDLIRNFGFLPLIGKSMYQKKHSSSYSCL